MGAVMRVRVTHTLGDLVADLAAVKPKFDAEAPGIVERNNNKGNAIAQRIAREKSGPHGSNYPKRLSAEMTDELTAEYGPHDGGTPVGAGFRHGGPNMDLPNSADLIGPEFADEVGDMAERLLS
jgi:hypothetical protein